MNYRILPGTDIALSVIGFGAAAIGGGRDYGFARRDTTESLQTILRGFECGINWVDTAPKYADGHAEELVGRALRHWKEPVFVATKCGYPYDEDTGKPLLNLKREAIFREIDESLSRLGVDTIDLYQIHWPLPDEDIEEAFAAVTDLADRGKVRYAGVSNFSVGHMERIRGIGRLTALQSPYSILHRDIEDSIIPYCDDHRIGVLVYSPLQSGLLTGSFDRARIAAIPEGDWRRRSRHFIEPLLSRNLDIVGRLARLASDSGITPIQLAIAWTLACTTVTSSIIGARTPAQIEATAAAGSVDLEKGTLENIRSILDEVAEASDSLGCIRDRTV